VAEATSWGVTLSPGLQLKQSFKDLEAKQEAKWRRKFEVLEASSQEQPVVSCSLHDCQFEPGTPCKGGVGIYKTCCWQLDLSGSKHSGKYILADIKPGSGLDDWCMDLQCGTKRRVKSEDDSRAKRARPNADAAEQEVLDAGGASGDAQQHHQARMTHLWL